MEPRLPLLHRKCRRETVEKFSNGGTSRGMSPSGGKFQKPCQKYLKERQVLLLASPRVPAAQNKRNCRCAFETRSVLFYMQRRANSQTKDQRRMGKTGKSSIARVRNVKKLGCVSQDVDSSSQTSLNSIVKKGRRSSRFDLRMRYSSRRFWKLTACPGNAL